MTTTRELRALEARNQEDLDTFMPAAGNVFDIDPRVKEEGYGYLCARASIGGTPDTNIEQLLAQRYDVIPAMKEGEAPERGRAKFRSVRSNNPYQDEYYCKGHDMLVLRRATCYNEKEKEFYRTKYKHSIQNAIGEEKGGLKSYDAMKLLHGGHGF